MGLCLCRSKTSDDLPDNLSHGGRSMDQRSFTHTDRCDESTLRLAQIVDRLVKETLKVIGTIADNEPEPPSSMIQLHAITDNASGWIQLVKTLIRVVPLEHPMGPSVITLLLGEYFASSKFY